MKTYETMDAPVDVVLVRTNGDRMMTFGALVTVHSNRVVEVTTLATGITALFAPDFWSTIEIKPADR